MSGKRFVVVASGHGALTAYPVGDERRAQWARERGFRQELARVNRPFSQHMVHAAYDRLVRIYGL